MGGAVGVIGGLLGGGSAGGVLGGLLGGSGFMGSLIGGSSGILSGLASKFGLDDVVQGITNLAGDFLQKELGNVIDSLPIPGFMKDGAKNLVAQVIGNEQVEIPCDCQEAVNEELGDTVKSFVDSIIEWVQQQMQEENEEATQGSGNKGGEKGNWLMILASALGKQSGEHLKAMVDKGTEIGDFDATVDPQGYAKVQAEFQAAGQMFKLSQEGISTMLKSIGEGLSAVARKQ